MTAPWGRSGGAEPFPLDPEPMPPLHWKGTPGARDVPTANFDKMKLALEDAFSVQGLVAVIGEPGLGKTHDCGVAVRDLGLRPAYFPVEVGPVGKEFETGALASLTKGYNRSNARSVMKVDLARAAVTWPLVWVLDDVERAQGYGIELVRGIWSRGANKFTIVLIGNDLMGFLDGNRALRDRVCRWVFYEPSDEAVSVAFARAYHPMYERADQRVLEHIDRQAAHGVARQWAQTTEALITDGFDWEHGRLTVSVVEQALARRFQR